MWIVGAECRSTAWWGHRTDPKWWRWFDVRGHDGQHRCPRRTHHLLESGRPVLASRNLRWSPRQGACVRGHPSGPSHRRPARPPDIFPSSSAIPASGRPPATQSLSPCLPVESELLTSCLLCGTFFNKWYLCFYWFIYYFEPFIFLFVW